VLAHTAARAAAPLFNPLTKFGVRTPEAPDNSHQETGQDRTSNRELENWIDRLVAVSVFHGRKLEAHSRNQRTKCHATSASAPRYADE